MLARNSDLCRLASSSSRLCSLSSRKSWAFCRARADWLANVSRRSTVSSVKSPVRFRRMTSDPTMRPSRSIGTATSERQPSSYRICRCGSSGTAARSGTAIGSALPGGASDEGLVHVDADRAQPLDDAGRVGRRCGPEDRSGSSYSMIEPPSVPDSSTACIAIVDSTSSTSRLELTASPTSRSASSSSTLRASSAPRLQLLDQLDGVHRHGAWPANARRSPSPARRTGCTSLRQTRGRRRPRRRGASARPWSSEPAHPLEVVAP
jgi:hypothetical protein